MRKLLLGAAAFALLATSSCKKDDDSSSTPTNQWTVGSNTYHASTAGSVNSNGSGLTATDVSQNGNSITFLFSGGTPAANGTYTVSSTSGAGNVAVVATDISSSGSYKVNSGTVTVTVNSGKLSISMPSSPASYVGTSTKPNVQVTANISQ